MKQFNRINKPTRRNKTQAPIIKILTLIEIQFHLACLNICLLSAKCIYKLNQQVYLKGLLQLVVRVPYYHCTTIITVPNSAAIALTANGKRPLGLLPYKESSARFFLNSLIRD